MSWLRELLSVALGGLAARKMRTVLIMLGPILGAAGIVAAVGLIVGPTVGSSVCPTLL